MKSLFIMSVTILALLIAGCANVTTRESQGMATPSEASPAVGPAMPTAGGPVIERAYAASEIYPRDTWKIYLKASDPTGHLKYIVAEVYQPGVGQYPVSYTRIKGGNAKDLNGYVYLTTAAVSASSLNYFTLNLTIHIRDSAGRYSQPKHFSVYFNPQAPRQIPPPPGEFREQDLGPIMVPLRPFNTAGREDFF